MPNGSSALSTIAFVQSSSTLPSLRPSGLMRSAPPPTLSTSVPAGHAMTPHHTSSYTGVLQATTTCACSDASAIPAWQPRLHTSCLTDPPPASSSATQRTQRATAALTWTLTALLSPVTFTSTRMSSLTGPGLQRHLRLRPSRLPSWSSCRSRLRLAHADSTILPRLCRLRRLAHRLLRPRPRYLHCSPRHLLRPSQLCRARRRPSLPLHHRSSQLLHRHTHHHPPTRHLLHPFQVTT